MDTSASISTSGQVPKQEPLTDAQPKQAPKFVEDTADILARYASFPPSIELHIHPTHYRFGGQEGIIPRNNPVMSLFFEYVREGVIPPVAGEVFRDSAVRLYEGCAILKLIDYRAQSATKASGAANGDVSPKPRTRNMWDNELSHNPPDADEKKPVNMESKDADLEKQKPDTELATNNTSSSSVPSYRVLLRPTPGGLFQDLMCITDSGIGRRLTDYHAVSLESEILNSTVRKLDLRVPERADWDKGLRVASHLATSSKGSFKYVRHRATHPRRPRILHEESPHKGTAYEDFMLVLADSTEKRNRAPSQFLRMSFIEQVRRKKYADPPAASAAAAAAAAAAGSRRAPGALGGPSAGQTAAPSSALGATASQPPAPAQPTPEQLAQQVQQAQLMAQSQRFPQQPGVTATMPQHHVPPGPTASHQIQAQAQQQAIMRARAAQQMMRQQSPRTAQNGAVARPPSGQARPVSSMGQNANVQQRMARSGQMSSMGPMNGMSPQMNNMAMSLNGVNPAIGSPMGAHMSPQINRQMSPMNSQMSPQMAARMSPPQANSQMSPQMNAQMNAQMGGQMGNQMGSQMGAQIGSQMGSQMNSHMNSQINSQMNSPVNSHMSSMMGTSAQTSNPQLMQGGRMPSQMQNRVARMPIGTLPNANMGQQVPTQIPSQVQQQLRRMSSQQMSPVMMGRQRQASQNGQQYVHPPYSPNMN